MTSRSVPRETEPPGDTEPPAGIPPPPAASRVFGRQLPVIVRYAELLAGPGTERGLLGPREAPRLWDRHLLNCAVVSRHVPPGAAVCDVGSGSGLPGIVVAAMRPDISMTLLEPLLRRFDFLQEAVATLQLDNVRVLRGRAETVPLAGQFDSVLARAVAPLDRLASWALRLLRPGGELMALKGSTAAAELDACRSELRRLGVSEAAVHEERADDLVEPTWIVHLRAGPARGTAGNRRQGH